MNLETIWTAPTGEADAESSRGAPMPDELVARYGGPLEMPLIPDRPTLLANFVSTLDGVVALGPGEERGGGVISGRFEPDRGWSLHHRVIAALGTRRATTAHHNQQLINKQARMIGDSLTTGDKMSPALTSAADLTFLPVLRLVRRRNVKSKAALES